jgi:hypothetical protein
VLAAIVVLVSSVIGVSLTETGSHRAKPAPTPTLTATPTPAPSPSGGTVPADITTCQDSDLSVALVAGGVGLGTWHALIGFTNISTQVCTIGGYPSVVAIDQGGATVTGSRSPSSGLVSPSYPAGAVITLASGEQAGAELTSGQIGTSGRTCPSYQWLRVTAPNGYLHWEISSFFGQYIAVCGLFSLSPLYPRAAFPFSPQAIISPTTSPSPATAPCTASQLIAHQTFMISVASQPLTVVAFYNVSSTACYLIGYPTIDAASDGSQSVPVSAVHSGNYERPDPGPSRVDVPPGGAVSFAIGSSTAMGGGLHPKMLTRLTLSLPAAGGHLQVSTTIGVSRLSDTAPYPLSETALVAGPNGPNP